MTCNADFSFICEQHTAILIRSLQLESGHDILYIGGYMQPLAWRNISGERSPQLLYNGEMGVQYYSVDTNVVNITFVSDNSVESEGFELYVFPITESGTMKIQSL